MPELTSVASETTELSSDEARQMLREMILIRRFEERCAELYSATKIRGFLHLYIGEEAIAVGAMTALRPDDSVLATYRDHGQALARGVPAEKVMAEMFGKIEGCSRGRGGSMHLFDAEHRFFGGNAIVGGGLPVALGIALADKKRGTDNVTVCFFGEGAMAEGEFHETMNLAELWQLPILFACENNYYAMGTALSRSESQTDLVAKAASYGVPAVSVDGMDIEAVVQTTGGAIEAIRAGSGPQFIEYRTYRFRAHSMYDPELYRDKAEVEEWKHRDPIMLFEAVLTQRGDLTADDKKAIETEVKAEIDAAVAFAEAGQWEPVEDLERFVYSERSVA